MPFRIHEESNECKVKFGSVYERQFHVWLDNSDRWAAGVFTGVSAEIQNDLIECIDSAIEDQIKKEIKECTFLSTQVHETAYVSTKEQLSIIIRFGRNGEIIERVLLKFKDSTDRSTPAVSDIVTNNLAEHGPTLKDKLIMQMYDV